ncbi:MAG: hypothetical protein QOF28_2003 [Actinomycetota bacterium]|jgi:hypothetical protein|nr:hypothetical protein [Actinomycetota bacterium]
MRHMKKLTLLAVAMLSAVACARCTVRNPYKANFTW